MTVAAVGPITLYTPAGSRRWVVTTLVLVANGAVSVTLYSNVTAVTGPILFAANQQLIVAGDSARNVLRGLNLGDPLTITLTGAIQFSGWLQIREVGSR